MASPKLIFLEQNQLQTPAKECLYMLETTEQQRVLPRLRFPGSPCHLVLKRSTQPHNQKEKQTRQGDSESKAWGATRTDSGRMATQFFPESPKRTRTAPHLPQCGCLLSQFVVFISLRQRRGSWSTLSDQIAGLPWQMNSTYLWARVRASFLVSLIRETISNNLRIPQLALKTPFAPVQNHI